MLTHLIILALTVLPVQVISASAKNVSMQISMNQQVSVNNECLHEMSDQKLIAEIKNNSTANACCDDQSSSCQGCNDISQATTAMTPPVITLVKVSLLTSTK